MDQPNLTYINKLSNGDDVFRKKLISIIKFEFPIEKESYYKSIKYKDFNEAAATVHKIKHKISILSFMKGYELALEHENSLRSGNNDLEDKFNDVLVTITNYLYSI